MPRRSSRPTRSCKYTSDQVLRGIKAFVEPHWDPEVFLELDRPLYDYFETAVDSHECPLDLLTELAAEFGLDWGPNRWFIWLGLRSAKQASKRKGDAWERWEREVAPTKTVLSLVKLIMRKAVAPSLAPATMFGVTCEKAGVFLGICDMPEVRGRRVAPSTPLRALRSSSRVRELIRRLEWVAGVKLPSTHGPKPGSFSTWADATWNGGALTALIVGLAAFVALGPTSEFAASAFWGILAGAATLAITWTIADRIHDPLPAELVTFGDLARLVASVTAAGSTR